MNRKTAIGNGGGKHAIDPAKWLKGFEKKCATLNDCATPTVTIGMGKEVLGACNGCARTAMTREPDLRAEILLACLHEDSEVGECVRQKVIGLSRIVEQLSED